MTCWAVLQQDVWSLLTCTLQWKPCASSRPGPSKHAFCAWRAWSLTDCFVHMNNPDLACHLQRSPDTLPVVCWPSDFAVLNSISRMVVHNTLTNGINSTKATERQINCLSSLLEASCSLLLTAKWHNATCHEDSQQNRLNAGPTLLQQLVVA